MSTKINRDVGAVVEIFDHLTFDGKQIVVADGRPLAQYLAETGFKPGDQVNIVRRDRFIALDLAAEVGMRFTQIVQSANEIADGFKISAKRRAKPMDDKVEPKGGAR